MSAAPPPAISVLLADDDERFRAVYRKLFARTEGFRVAGEAADGAAAARLTAALRPEVALLDVQMPGTDGLEAARRILTGTRTRVIMLTTFDLDEYVHAALTLGAAGFLLKNAAPPEVLQAVRAVHAGNAMLAPEVTARLVGQFAPAPRRVDEVLDAVGLTGAARQRVRRYSLGMTRRLGIAAALLGEPAVLVLDEPVNGLDPDGIRWVRRLVRDHAGAGGTVLLSSHLMTEVEAVADDVVVIHRGRVLTSGPLNAVTAGHASLEAAFFALTGDGARW